MPQHSFLLAFLCDLWLFCLDKSAGKLETRARTLICGAKGRQRLCSLTDNESEATFFWTQLKTVDIYTRVLAFEIAPKEHLCKAGESPHVRSPVKMSDYCQKIRVFIYQEFYFWSCQRFTGVAKKGTKLSELQIV